jgi:transposase-like protein
LRDLFPDEESCRDYLTALRWPAGFRCPACQSADHWVTSRHLFHCRACARQSSVTAGTLFMDTHLPLRLWFEAIWQVTSQKYGASALGLQRVLGMGSYRTAWTLLHKLRRAMVRPGRDRLKGLVEADEIYVGGVREQAAKFDNKALVLVAVEEVQGKIGRIRLLRIADRSGVTLREAIGQLVEPGARVRTDDWQGYARIDEMGYSHQPVHYTAAGPKNLLPLVNRVVALLKRWLLGTHQGSVAPTHLDYYLDEFTFRFNRRTSNSRGLLFSRLLTQAVAMEPRPGKMLKGGRGELQKPQAVVVT